MIKLGLVGAGRWGQRYISTILAMEDVSLIHLISTNPNSKNLVPSSCKISVHWEDILADNSLDGLIIATPANTHAKIAVASIKAGFPVLIEKPMTLDLLEAREIIDTATLHKVYAVVDHTHLFSPAYLELKRHGKNLGCLKSIHSCGANWGPFRLDTSVLWDYGSHDVTMCLALVNDYPISINANLDKRIVTTQGIGEAIRLELGFAQSSVAEIQLSNIDERKSRWFTAVYEGGTIKYDDLSIPKLSLSVASGQMMTDSWTPINIDATPPLTQAVQSFCDNLKKNIHFNDEINLAFDVIKVLTACEANLSIKN